MGRAYFPIGKLKAALACVYFGFLTISILPHSGGFFNAFCISYYLCIKTRYTLSYLRAHRIGPDRLYDPGRFFPRSGRFTPIAPLKFFIQNRRCTSGFFLGDSSPMVRFTSACQLGTPAPPAVPLPRCRWEQLPIRGRRGPSLPAVPSLPHLRKTGFCIASGPLPQSYKGGKPLQNPAFCASAGACFGLGGPLASAPGG